MTGLIMKIFMSPLTLLISDYLFDQVNYGNLYQPIIVGLILALLAHLMELMLLRRGTLWLSLAADALAAVLLIYFISNLFAGARVTLPGAIFTAILIGVTEYVQHVYLITSDKTIKHS